MPCLGWQTVTQAGTFPRGPSDLIFIKIRSDGFLGLAINATVGAPFEILCLFLDMRSEVIGATGRKRPRQAKVTSPASCHFVLTSRGFHDAWSCIASEKYTKTHNSARPQIVQLRRVMPTTPKEPDRDTTLEVNLPLQRGFARTSRMAWCATYQN